MRLAPTGASTSRVRMPVRKRAPGGRRWHRAARPPDQLDRAFFHGHEHRLRDQQLADRREREDGRRVAILLDDVVRYHSRRDRADRPGTQRIEDRHARERIAATVTNLLRYSG